MPSIDWNDKIPQTNNFYMYELVKTNHNEGLHRQEFEALPEAEYITVIKNAIALGNRLQLIRDLVGFPLPTESWWRSERVNDLVGGAGSSHHRTGAAWDPQLNSIRLRDIRSLLNESNGLFTWSGGVGYGGSKLHLDIGPKRRPWKYG